MDGLPFPAPLSNGFAGIGSFPSVASCPRAAGLWNRCYISYMFCEGHILELSVQDSEVLGDRDRRDTAIYEENCSNRSQASTHNATIASILLPYVTESE